MQPSRISLSSQQHPAISCTKPPPSRLPTGKPAESNKTSGLYTYTISRSLLLRIRYTTPVIEQQKIQLTELMTTIRAVFKTLDKHSHIASRTDSPYVPSEIEQRSILCSTQLLQVYQALQASLDDVQARASLHPMVRATLSQGIECSPNDYLMETIFAPAQHSLQSDPVTDSEKIKHHSLQNIVQAYLSLLIPKIDTSKILQTLTSLETLSCTDAEKSAIQQLKNSLRALQPPTQDSV